MTLSTARLISAECNLSGCQTYARNAEIARLEAENAALKARLERANRIIEFAAYAIGAAERYAKITLSTNADTDAFADHHRALGRDIYKYIKRKAAYDRSEKP
jgi:hypothetical protein